MNRTIIPVFTLCVLLISCGKEKAEDATTGGEDSIEYDVSMTIDPSTPTYGVYQLLMANGNTVSLKGGGRPSLFDVEGYTLVVNGKDVYVYEFGSPEDLEAAAAKISADGTMIDGKPVRWAGPPSFYKTSRVMALYIGDDQKTRGALDAVGERFAGQ